MIENKGRLKWARSISAIITEQSTSMPKTLSAFCWAALWYILALTFSSVTPFTTLSRAHGLKISAISTVAASIWKLDLRSFGYSPPLGLAEGLGYALPSIGPLCFRTNSELTVAFITRAAGGSLAIRGEANAALPLRLNGLFIEMGAGKPHTRLEWPTASARSRILPTLGGKLVVITPDELILYSEDFRLVKTVSLPVSREGIRDSLRSSASPTGNYLLIEYDPNAGSFDASTAESRRLLINTQTLQVLGTWTLKGMNSVHSENISDDGMALTVDGTGSPEIGRPGGPWHVICHRPDPHCGYGIFVGNDAFFNPSVLHSQELSAMRLMLTNGQLIFERNLPDKQYVRMTARAADGRRFAVAVEKGKGGSAFFDIAPHYSLDRIMVYDLSSRQWVYALGAKTQGIKSISGLTLSPDGSLMALIDQEGTLEVYRLPPEAVGTQPRQAQTF